jgi:hypothetical protein
MVSGRSYRPKPSAFVFSRRKGVGQWAVPERPPDHAFLAGRLRPTWASPGGFRTASCWGSRCSSWGSGTWHFPGDPRHSPRCCWSWVTAFWFLPPFCFGDRSRVRANSSAGRALALHARGHRFEPCFAHQRGVYGRRRSAGDVPGVGSPSGDRPAGRRRPGVSQSEGDQKILDNVRTRPLDLVCTSKVLPTGQLRPRLSTKLKQLQVVRKEVARSQT